MVGSGDAVMLVPVHRQLTTQQAADILNMSRPHLIKLLDKGEMPQRMVGRHRRVQVDDVFAYRERMAERCDESLSCLAKMDADLI